MKPLVFNTGSTCCEGTLLPAFKSTPAVPSRQRLSVLLTSTAACTRNTDEDVCRTHWRLEVIHNHPRGQQVKRSVQQLAIMPHGQQAYPPDRFWQHLWFGHCVPSGH